jgi:hypothetical protein
LQVVNEKTQVVELRGLCPACGDPLPAYSGRGRPSEWCSYGCRSLAFRERRRAAELRVYSRRLLELADEIDAGRKHGFGTSAGQRQRAAEIRAMADEVDARFGKGPG